MNARNILLVALLLLATLYAFWFAHDAHPVAALLVFALPPALCAIAVDAIRGMDIAITTTANTNEEAKALLEAFRFPFRN